MTAPWILALGALSACLAFMAWRVWRLPPKLPDPLSDTHTARERHPQEPD